jgi:hypothetical protein
LQNKLPIQYARDPDAISRAMSVGVQEFERKCAQYKSFIDKTLYNAGARLGPGGFSLVMEFIALGDKEIRSVEEYSIRRHRMPVISYSIL